MADLRRCITLRIAPALGCAARFSTFAAYIPMRPSWESPKFEKAAMKWLRRYLEESEPTLRDLNKVVSSLAARQL